MKKKKLALHWKILIGMILGIAYGLIAVNFDMEGVTQDWIKPFGTIFINLLKLIAVPLILFSLVSGIANLKDISKLSRMGLKTVGMYILTTVIAVSLGLLLVNAIDPGSSFPQEEQQALEERYGTDVNKKQMDAASVQDESYLQFLVDMVPSNLVEAMSENSRMLQVIFFSIFCSRPKQRDASWWTRPAPL